MKIRLYLSLCLLCFSSLLFAQESLKIGGDIRSNLYVGLVYGDIYNYFNSNVVTIRGESKPNENVQGNFEIRFRNENISELDRLSELKYRKYVEPVSLQIYESYIQFSSIFIKEMDLRFGKQRIAWGTADGFNPTDNFSPMDLEDPLDFKSKLSVWALNTTFYYSSFDLSVVFQPLFEPALLPNFDLLSQGSDQMMQNYRDRLQEPLVRLPEFRAKNFIYGTRLRYKGELFDISGSFFHGYAGVPVVGDIKIETGGFALKSITPVLCYPSQNVAGLDIAMNLFDIGIFGEMAFVFPEKVEPVYYVNGNRLQEKDKKTFGIPEGGISVEDKPYMKFAGGFDYTFKGGYYLNVQYIRGFFNEVSYSAINNYVFAYMKKEFFDSVLEIQPSFGFEFDSDSDEKFGGEKLRDEKAYIFSLETTYVPFNTGKITLGGAMARGDNGSNLKMFEKLDQIYLKFRLDF
ncbi:MAG: hypothetical protein N3B13_01640 [Deltaproteobacteria bacterium]|nr:hypothetical protein [Deltaproteobacteria bacterium]